MDPSSLDQANRLTVERVVDEWEVDSKIDPSELGNEQLKIEQLHSKFLKLLARAKRELRAAEGALRKLRLDKFEFYTMGHTAESRAQGWKLPPRGRIVLKAEARDYVDADPDVIAAAAMAGEAQDVVDAVTEKVKMIAFRGNRIASAIEWHLFTHGR